MKKYYITFTIISLTIVLSTLFVSIKYKNDLQFAPEIFVTEIIKFVSLTVAWTIIFNYYNKFDRQRKKKKLIEYLITSNVTSIQHRMTTSLQMHELTMSINNIANNLILIRVLNEFSPQELNEIVKLENSLFENIFKKHISDIEFLVEKKLEYHNTEAYTIITNKLKELLYVFRNQE